jgi:hypothetical protein
MNGFYEYLEYNGVKDVRTLSAFVCRFLKDPAIFFDLSELERGGMEKKLDEALALFKNKRAEDNPSDFLFPGKNRS